VQRAQIVLGCADGEPGAAITEIDSPLCRSSGITNNSPLPINCLLRQKWGVLLQH